MPAMELAVARERVSKSLAHEVKALALRCKQLIGCRKESSDVAEVFTPLTDRSCERP